MTDKITALHFDDENENNKEMFNLINQLVEQRPSHTAAGLVREVLLDTLPIKIAELKAKKNKAL
jgi:hypothetical protein